MKNFDPFFSEIDRILEGGMNGFSSFIDGISKKDFFKPSYEKPISLDKEENQTPATIGKFNFPHMLEFKPFKNDIIEKTDCFIVKAELPGYKKEQVNIDIQNDQLVITAHKEDVVEEETDAKILRKEIYSGSIKHTFSLKNVDIDRITASMEDGILTVNMPKKVITETTRKSISID